ncbi:unnamed protein product [Hapterophycus canaliculatus]
MHQVVSQTMAKVRRDRPVHLLGIGGIADIFHGVRQGVDTFDCVHPTRLGRHGGALVKASFWEREREVDDEAERAAAAEAKKTGAAAAAVGGVAAAAGVGAGMSGEERRRERRRKKAMGGRYTTAKRQRIKPREHVNLLKGRFEDDHRPIDEDCGCPTCRGG